MFATPSPAISVSTSLVTQSPSLLARSRSIPPTNAVFTSYSNAYSNAISTTASAATPAQSLLSPDDMDTLTGPIALYPDALIAIILPASTYSSDIVLAARFLDANGDSAQAQTLAGSQPWDQSVRALAHYPDVLHWMDQNLAWTQQLGAAFFAQPEDVMASIQRLRARAQAAGNLTTNTQQTVFAQDDYIRIVPTYEDVLYVPYYDPMEAFYQPVTFGWGPPWAIGPWLVYDCNWIGLNIWIGPWSPRYFMMPQWGVAGWRRISPKWLLQHVWRPDPSRLAKKPPAPPSRHKKSPVPRPTPIANIRSIVNGSASVPGSNGLPHRFVAPKALQPTAPALASAPATTMAGIVNQPLTKTSQSQAQTQAQTQTPQSQNNSSGNVNNNVNSNSDNNNTPRNVQRPGTLPPARYATQGATRTGQLAQQQSRWSGQPAQQQPRWFGQSSSGQQQQQSHSAGHAGNAPASNAAPSNSNSGKANTNSRSSGNTNSSTHYSPPSSSSSHYSPPASSSNHDSSSSSSSHSSSSSSSSRDSNSRDDSGDRPRR